MRIRSRLLRAIAVWLAACIWAHPALATDPAPPEAAPSPANSADSPAPETLAQALDRLAKQEFDLTRALDSARLDVESARRRFEAAQQRLDRDPEPSEALRAEVAARRLQLESGQRIAALLEERIERIEWARQAWRRLDQLGGGRVGAEELAEWGSVAERAVEELPRELAVKRARVEEVKRDIGFTQERAVEIAATSPLARWTATQRRALETLERSLKEDLASIESNHALAQRLSEAVAVESEQLPFTARLRGMLHHVQTIWNYELTGSEKEPITPGKIVSAILIFLIGWVVARQVARVMGERLFPRLRLQEGASQAFQSLAFYVLMLLAFLTALRMVQIPLTAFAVVGGALAIGVGFGSQNVVNNFISGIILLVERPIKLNDLIEVDGVYGNVESIGLRSTRVRTGDNVHIIVPNASFLEGNVVNWTHSDPKVRIKIEVGVAYGSPTRDVARLIREAVDAQPQVLRDPEPVVLFTEFGDNALGFETRFWIEMRTVLSRLRIESEVRFRIDDLFRDAGIVIAFPQRDVHLDSLSPVEVRLVGSEPGERADDPEA